MNFLKMGELLMDSLPITQGLDEGKKLLAEGQKDLGQRPMWAVPSSLIYFDKCVYLSEYPWLAVILF